MSGWEFQMTQAIGTYAKTTKVPSIWFYTENDSRFLPDLARMAHNEYLKKWRPRKALLRCPLSKRTATIFSAIRPVFPVERGST